MGIMPESRYQEIWAQVRRKYPGSAHVALVEGLPALARIALTARVARRAQRFFLLQSAFAKQVVEGAIRAAEKAAAGESITVEEDQAARDSAVLAARDCEKRDGNEAGAEGACIARPTARCVYDPEFAYGEMFFLAYADLQFTVEQSARSRGLRPDEVERTIRGEVDGVRTDVERLIICSEATGEGWVDPELGRPFDRRNDRGWENLMTSRGIPLVRCDENRERWQRIHEAIRQTGGGFYPPTVFDPLLAAKISG